MAKSKVHSKDIAYKQAGFSMVEILLSLAIVCLLASLASIRSNHYSQQLEEVLFFNQLESQMNHMQLRSITGQKMSHVRFLRRGVFFQTSQQQENHDKCFLAYPPTVQLKSHSFYFDFKAGSGRTNQFKTVRFNTSKGELALVFQIANGRYYLNWQE